MCVCVLFYICMYVRMLSIDQGKRLPCSYVEYVNIEKDRRVSYSDKNPTKQRKHRESGRQCRRGEMRSMKNW